MSYKYLTFADRQKIESLHSQGKALAEIAKDIKCSIATIYNELNRGDTGELDKNGRNGYSADLAQKNINASLKCRGKKQPQN